MTREEEIKKQAEKKALEPSRLMHPYAKQHKVMSAYEIGFIEGAVWADEHPHWISVRDKLPPKKTGEASDKVLVYDAETNRVGASWYIHSTGKWFNGWDSVTHWMPLPAPPESGSSEIPNNCEKGGEKTHAKLGQSEVTKTSDQELFDKIGPKKGGEK